MKPHKHAEIIKAWADGAEIEYTPIGQQDWKPIFAGWSWENSLVAMYRIKPEPKPDIKGVLVKTGLGWQEHSALHWAGTWIEGFAIIRDGETNELKSAEVLK